jgi:branched-chain amino acid transport system ATP-binding protein
VIERMARVLRAERDESGVAMLIVEQHVDFALSVADRYAVLKLGEITDRGDVASPGARHHITDQLSI